MVRKTQFSREDVVQAAFMVVKKQGIDALSARNVAQELGSSTAPVYSNFQSMEQLEIEVFGRAAAKFLDYATQEHTESPFLNMGVGVLKFARECPQWYLAMNLRRELGAAQLSPVVDQLLAIMARVPGLDVLHPLERKLLLRKMEIFTHGMAWEICAGDVDDQTMNSFIKLMQEVGETLGEEARNRPARPENEIEELALLCHETVAVPPKKQRKDEGNENQEN